MLLANLKGKKIILASKSPRRHSLVSGLDIDFEIEIREVEEIYPSEIPLHDVPEFLAKLKASPWSDNLENKVVITADTVVIHLDVFFLKSRVWLYSDDALDRHSFHK